jgi:hypothetical protein
MLLPFVVPCHSSDLLHARKNLLFLKLRLHCLYEELRCVYLPFYLRDRFRLSVHPKLPG